MAKYKANSGLSLPDGSRVEAGETFEGSEAGGSLDWLEKQGHVELVETGPAKPDADVRAKKEA